MITCVHLFIWLAIYWIALSAILTFAALFCTFTFALWMNWDNKKPPENFSAVVYQRECSTIYFVSNQQDERKKRLVLLFFWPFAIRYFGKIILTKSWRSNHSIFFCVFWPICLFLFRKSNSVYSFVKLTSWKQQQKMLSHEICFFFSF